MNIKLSDDLSEVIKANAAKTNSSYRRIVEDIIRAHYLSAQQARERRAAEYAVKRAIEYVNGE